jgi:hypothetical protein
VVLGDIAASANPQLKQIETVWRTGRALGLFISRCYAKTPGLSPSLGLA